MPFKVVPRRWWKATPPKHSFSLEHPVTFIYLSGTGTRPCNNMASCTEEARYIQQRHLANSASDVVFNFMIGASGLIMEGRGWHSTPKIGQKYYNYSKNSLHIGFVGDFKFGLPSTKMLQALTELLKFGIEKKYISERFLECTSRLYAPQILNPTDALLDKIA